MKIKEHALAIVEYSEVFESVNFLDLLEEECANEWAYIHWERSAVGDGFVSNVRTSMSCELNALGNSEISVQRVIPLAQAWQKIFIEIDKCVWDYRNNFELELQSDEGYRVLKYGGGAEYLSHTDHHQDNSRSLSLVAFMNDNYTGGELVFPRLKTSIVPRRGSVILFPSNFPYIHAAKPVGIDNEDTKYSLVTWFR